jgi:hypothetical protein
MSFTKMSKCAVHLLEGAVHHALATVVEHERGGGAVPDLFPGGLGVEVHRLGERQRLDGHRDVDPTQRLVDELDLAVPGRRSHHGDGPGQRLERAG